MYTKQKTKARIAKKSTKWKAIEGMIKIFLVNFLLLTICWCACPYLPYMQNAPLLVKHLLFLFKWVMD